MSKSICIVQNIDEIIYILNKVKKHKIFLPLDLSTQLYCINNKIKFYDPLKMINKSFHQETLVYSKKLIQDLDFGDISMDSHKKELRALIRFKFHSIAFLLELIEQLKFADKVDEIIVTGWDRYYDQYSKKNIFVSDLVLNLIKDIKITSLNKIIYQNYSTNEECDFLVDDTDLEKNKEYILVTNLGYNFFRIIMSLQRQKMKIIVPFLFKISFFKKIIYNLLKVKFIELKKTKSLDSSQIILPKIKFIYKGKDLSKILNSRLMQEKKNIIKLKNQSKAIDNFFKRTKIKLVITNLSRGIFGYFIDLAKKLKITSICIPHGTLAPNFDEYDRLYKDTISEAVTSKNADFHASQSIIAKEFFELKKNNFNKILNTGNLIFCGKKRKIKKKKNKILFAVTLKDFETIRPLGDELYYEFLDNLYFLENLSKKYEFKFLVKLHPRGYDEFENLKKAFPKLEFSKKKIDKALDESFVTLTFSSTTIEDSLSAQCPVILLDRWKRYKHCIAEENTKKKNSAVYYIDDGEKLVDCLNTISSSENIDFSKYYSNNNYNFNIKKTLDNLLSE